MKFCNKCGNTVKEDQHFCNSCGNDLSKVITNQIETNTEVNEEIKLMAIIPEESIGYNFKLSKACKIALAVVVTLILIVVILIQVGNSLSDPKKLVSRFEKDVAANNASDLVSILYSNDARLTIDSKSITPLLLYFKTNPSYFEKVIQNLNSDALNPKDIRNLNISSGNTLTLITVGKKFLIFPDYKINIKPSFIDITAGVKDTIFSINNAEIGKSDSDNSIKEFGPYIPGNYTILANYTGKYITLNKPYTVDLVSTTNGAAKLNVFDDVSYLNISSDYPDAEVFVNGKDANIKVKDANKFGPVDSSVKIYATYMQEGKTLKSEEYTISNYDKDIYLSFQYSKNALSDTKSALNDLLQYYTSYFTYAVNTNNISLINPYVAAGSDLYKEQLSYIPKTYNAGIKESIISANITNYNISDDNKSGSITTSEVYNITRKDGSSYNQAFSYIYNFKYNDSTYSYQFTGINKAN
ncbi:MAG: zinc ribbon domain-containing protein [Bacillota bacterium]|nr:zinc ribbon domain-containing protein [Bacillota bacterium]